jgi:hypothetical protein
MLVETCGALVDGPSDAAGSVVVVGGAVEVTVDALVGSSASVVVAMETGAAVLASPLAEIHMTAKLATATIAARSAQPREGRRLVDGSLSSVTTRIGSSSTSFSLRHTPICTA